MPSGAAVELRVGHVVLVVRPVIISRTPKLWTSYGLAVLRLVDGLGVVIVGEVKDAVAADAEDDIVVRVSDVALERKRYDVPVVGRRAALGDDDGAVGGVVGGILISAAADRTAADSKDGCVDGVAGVGHPQRHAGDRWGVGRTGAARDRSRAGQAN